MKKIYGLLLCLLLLQLLPYSGVTADCNNPATVKMENYPEFAAEIKGNKLKITNNDVYSITFGIIIELKNGDWLVPVENSYELDTDLTGTFSLANITFLKFAQGSKEGVECKWDKKFKPVEVLIVNAYTNRTDMCILCQYPDFKIRLSK